MKTAFQIALLVVAVIIGYYTYKTIEEPIQFEKAKKERYTKVVSKLKDIRKAELAYKTVHGQFTGSWDTLINFVQHDSLPLVRKIGMLTDSMIEAGWTEEKAMKKGRIIRDTIRINVQDTLFGKAYPVNKLMYVPVPDTVAEFYLGATILKTGSGIRVPVFEASVHNNTILHGLNRQLIINLNDERRANKKYPGLRVGNLKEANNNAGNWE